MIKSKVLNVLGTLKKIKDDPINFIIDMIIRIVANIFIPIPMAGELIVALKKPIMGLIFATIAISLSVLIIIGSVILIPASSHGQMITIIETIINNVLGAFQDGSSLNLDALKGYVEDGISETGIPSRNPFGGGGTSWVLVTASYMNIGYFTTFGTWHTGLDMVPNGNYYSNNKAYKMTNQVIIFATVNGSVNYYTDMYGGKTVEITNDSNSLKTINIHFSQVFVNSGDHVRAGQPIGIMGSTGHSTGPHLHYEIRINTGSGWSLVNPTNYIN